MSTTTLFPAVTFREEFHIDPDQKLELLGEPHTVFSTAWRIGVQQTKSNPKADDLWTVYLFIRENPQLQPWRVSVRTSVTLVHPTDASRSVSNHLLVTFNNQRQTSKLLCLYVQPPMFVQDEKLVMEASVEVLAVSGISPNVVLDFDAPDHSNTEIVNVGHRRFCVSKTILGTYSKVLHRMFYGENGDVEENEIILEQDIEPEHFLGLLRIIYNEPSITASNIEDLCRIAHRLQVPHAKRILEDIIVNNCSLKQFSVFRRIKMADAYDLDSVLIHALSKIRSEAGIHNLVPAEDTLQTKTLVAIMSRLVEAGTRWPYTPSHDYGNECRRAERGPTDAFVIAAARRRARETEASDREVDRRQDEAMSLVDRLDAELSEAVDEMYRLVCDPSLQPPPDDEAAATAHRQLIRRAGEHVEQRQHALEEAERKKRNLSECHALSQQRHRLLDVVANFRAEASVHLHAIAEYEANVVGDDDDDGDEHEPSRAAYRHHREELERDESMRRGFERRIEWIRGQMEMIQNRSTHHEFCRPAREIDPATDFVTWANQRWISLEPYQERYPFAPRGANPLNPLRGQMVDYMVRYHHAENRLAGHMAELRANQDRRARVQQQIENLSREQREQAQREAEQFEAAGPNF